MARVAGSGTACASTSCAKVGPESGPTCVTSLDDSHCSQPDGEVGLGKKDVLSGEERVAVVAGSPRPFERRALAAAGLNVAFGLVIIEKFANGASMKLPVWS